MKYGQGNLGGRNDANGSKAANGGNLHTGPYHAPHVIKATDGFKKDGINPNQKMKSKGNA